MEELMGKKKKCKGKKMNYESTIKFPIRKQCAHCGKQMVRDYYDNPKYEFQGKEFCSQQCYSNHINKNSAAVLANLNIKVKKGK